jgi:hypothetical protein
MEVGAKRWRFEGVSGIGEPTIELFVREHAGLEHG